MTPDKKKLTRRSVLHQSRVLTDGCSTLTTTLCGRLRTGGDGMNIAEPGEVVTCKFCLRSLSLKDPTHGQ